MSDRMGTIYADNMQNIRANKINVGVLQGDIVVPYLFLIAIAPLLNKLESVMLDEGKTAYQPVVSFDVTIVGNLHKTTKTLKKYLGCPSTSRRPASYT